MGNWQSPVKMARESKNMGVEELAKKAGVAPTTIRGIESEITSRRPVDRDVMEKVAGALGLPVGKLFNADQRRTPLRDKSSQSGHARSKQALERRGAVCNSCNLQKPLVNNVCEQCRK